MLRTFFTSSLRMLLKNRLSTFVNVFGLTLGLTCFTFILVFVEHELSFDRFHHDYQNTYRVVKDFRNNNGGSVPDATTPGALAAAIRNEIPEVLQVTRFAASNGRLYLMEHDDKRFYETRALRVDSSFFQVFNFPLIAGNKDHPFEGKHAIILTQSTARKYFNDDDPINKVIRINLNNGTDYLVTGVVRDVPSNSHFTFDFLIPFEGSVNPDENWSLSIFYTYARLNEGADPGVFESKIQQLFQRHQPESKDVYHVQALADIHLKSHLKSELGTNGDVLYVGILIIIAVLVILIACLNYVNLTTAQAVKRGKEVGVRKVIGALKSGLVRQFVFESIVMTTVALVISALLVALLAPFLKAILGYDFSAMLRDSEYALLVVPATAILIGILSGLYPALYLSSFKPLTALKGNFLVAGKGIRLRQTLVVFQFVISIGLVIGALVVQRQVKYMEEKRLGFNENNVILLPNVRGGVGDASGNGTGMVEEIRQMPEVTHVARADGIFGANNFVNGVGNHESTSHITLNFMRVDYEFLPAFEIAMKDGRNFSEDFASDSTAIILNETAVAQLGLVKPYIGQELSWDDEVGQTHPVKLIGVANDFHFSSFREAIKPFGFILEVNNGSNFFVKVHSQDLPATLAKIQQSWIAHFPDRPFQYAFQDEYMSRLYDSDRKFEKLFASFAGFAVVIACLGLFGLVTFITESRTKEIGIRKVLGASVPSILALLSRDFLWMFFIAACIASPFAYLAMRYWLTTFTYQVHMGWEIFVLAAMLSCFVALTTVAVQAIRAALANPVDSLHVE